MRKNAPTDATSRVGREKPPKVFSLVLGEKLGKTGKNREKLGKTQNHVEKNYGHEM